MQAPPMCAPPPQEGGHAWGAYLIAVSLPQTIYIALTQTKRLRKEINYVLIHNNTLQSVFWSSIALNIHVSHFEN